jgi:N-acetylated-alpha-linked acidic dipeptidase
VADYRDRAAGEVDLDSLVHDLARLREAVARWRPEAERAAGADAVQRRRANATLRRLARILVPLNYARGERFDHDPAIKLPVVPRLEIAARLADAPPDRKPFLKTALVRERNKVRAMIRAAMRELS